MDANSVARSPSYSGDSVTYSNNPILILPEVVAEIDGTEGIAVVQDGETRVTTTNDIALLALRGTFADNCAALAGGLTVNQLYKTPTGGVMVVFEQDCSPAPVIEPNLLLSIWQMPPPFHQGGRRGVRSLIEAPQVPPIVFYTGRTDQGISGSSYTFTNHAIGNPRGDRLIVCVFSSPSNNRIISSVTIGGNAMNIHIDFKAPSTIFGSVNIAVTSLPFPTGTTATINMTWNGLCDGTSVSVFAVYGLSSTTPTDTGTGSSSVADPTTQLDVASGGVIIGGFYNERQPGSITWTGLSDEANDASFPNPGGTGWASAASQAGLGAQTNRTITAASSSHPAMGVIAAVSWA